MEINAGQRCSLDGCGMLDFLPFTCEGCGGVFCKEHRTYDSHRCEKRLEDVGVMPECAVCGQHVRTKAGEDPNVAMGAHLDSGCADRVLEADARPKRKPCAARGCRNEKRYETVKCKACARLHCLSHRFPQDHECKGKREDRSARKMSPAAEALLKRLAAKKEAREAEAKPGRAGKAKRAGPPGLALRRVKLKARGDDRVPAAERFYLEVVPDPLVPGARVPRAGAKSMLTWFRRSWTVGRTLDDVCERMGVRNRNHEAGARRLALLFGDAELDTAATLDALPAQVPGFEEGACLKLGYAPDAGAGAGAGGAAAKSQ